MDIITNRLLRQAVPLFQVMAGVLLVIGISVILMEGKDVLVKLALAILLSFALAPIVLRLQRVGLSRALAVGASLLGALAIVATIFYVSYQQAANLAEKIPTYEPIIHQKLSSLALEMAGRGVFSDAADALSRVFAQLKTMGQSQDPTVQSVRVVTDVHGFDALLAYLGPLLAPLETLLVVTLLSAFMLIGREDLRNRVIRLAGTEDIQKTTAAIDDAARRVSKMLLAQFALNMAFGLIVGTGLWFIGLPSPYLWGILAGVLRFVPYIGAFVGLVPPLFVAFASDPSWASLLWTVGLFALVEPVVSQVVEPLLYGHSSGLSPVAIIVCATIWAFLWGPIGLVLSTPITICLVVLGRHIERMHFLDILLGDRPALEPHEILYQRMLANDPHEAKRQAEEFIKGRDLVTYYDEIAMPAIHRAHQDIARGTVAGDRLDAMVSATGALVKSLEVMTPSTRLSRGITAETEAAFDRIRTDRRAKLQILGSGQRGEKWHSAVPVAILHGEHPMDGNTAEMLAQAMRHYGLPALVKAQKQCAEISPDEQKAVALVCLTFAEPLSTLHIRAMTRQIVRHAPQAKVIVCIWQPADETLMNSLRKTLRVHDVSASITHAVSTALRMAVQKSGLAA